MAAKLYRKELVHRTKFNKIYSIRPVQKVRKLIMALHFLNLGIDISLNAPRVKVVDQRPRP